MVSSDSCFGIDVNNEVTPKDIVTSFFNIFVPLIFRINSADDVTDIEDPCYELKF